jgi:hypothetical protein
MRIALANLTRLADATRFSPGVTGQEQSAGNKVVSYITV